MGQIGKPVPERVLLAVSRSRCDTLAPVDLNDLRVVTPELSERDEVVQFFDDEGKRMFTDEVTRDGLCAFVAGTEAQLDQLEVTVTSILEFLPGMRVAIAAEDDAVDAYRRCVCFSTVVVVVVADSRFFCVLQHNGKGRHSSAGESERNLGNATYVADT